VATLLLALQVALIPPEVWAAMQREAALQAGRELPPVSERLQTIMRWVIPITTGLASALFALLLSGIVTFLFAFVLGDEGTFRQYLSLVSHAWLIPAVVGLLLVPLKISQQNPQFALSLGSFALFLDGGYVLRVLNLMDLSQMWSWAVVGAGAHAIDPRRGFGGATALLLLLQFALALVLGAFLPGP